MRNVISYMKKIQFYRHQWVSPFRPERFTPYRCQHSRGGSASISHPQLHLCRRAVGISVRVVDQRVERLVHPLPENHSRSCSEIMRRAG